MRFTYGEDSSPTDLGQALVQILSPTSNDKVLDCASGRMGFLFSVQDYLNESFESGNVWSCEINKDVYAKSSSIARNKGFLDSNLICAAF